MGGRMEHVELMNECFCSNTTFFFYFFFFSLYFFFCSIIEQFFLDGGTSNPLYSFMKLGH